MVTLLTILLHPSVLNVLNQNLFTEDVIFLTQLCKWTYFTWAQSRKFSLCFQFYDRILLKYRWFFPFTDPDKIMSVYRQEMRDSVITIDICGMTMCVGGCGKSSYPTGYLSLKINVVPVFTHYVCNNCVPNYFTKRRKHMLSTDVNTEVVCDLPGDSEDFLLNCKDYFPNLHYFLQTWSVYSNISGIRIISREIAQGFIEKWRQIYLEKIKQI